MTSNSPSFGCHRALAPVLRPTLVWYGDRVPSGAFTEHSRFTHVVNFERRGFVVSVSDETVAPGPASITIRDMPLTQCGTLFLAGARLTAAGYSFWLSPARRWSSRLCMERVDPARVRVSVRQATRHLLAAAPVGSIAGQLLRRKPSPLGGGFLEHTAETILRAVRLLFRGVEYDAVRLLSGTGLGLTPSGDDILIGHVAARQVLGHLGRAAFALPRRAFLRAASGTTALAYTAVRLAVYGSFAAPVKRFVEAVVNETESEVLEAGRVLMGMGSTSGSDVMAGFLLTMQEGLGS